MKNKLIIYAKHQCKMAYKFWGTKNLKPSNVIKYGVIVGLSIQGLR
jgi:hypothetical protein